MPTAEQITVKVAGHNGLALINTDAVRRLQELGFKRRKGKSRVRSSPHSRTQIDFLSGYPQIRGLEHYRQLISDERSDGPLVTYGRGAILLMERTETPKSKKIWYLVLDTAIGARPEFLDELQALGSISITGAAPDQPKDMEG